MLPCKASHIQIKKSRQINFNQSIILQQNVCQKCNKKSSKIALNFAKDARSHDSSISPMSLHEFQKKAFFEFSHQKSQKPVKFVYLLH